MTRYLLPVYQKLQVSTALQIHPDPGYVQTSGTYRELYGQGVQDSSHVCRSKPEDRSTNPGQNYLILEP